MKAQNTLLDLIAFTLLVLFIGGCVSGGCSEGFTSVGRAGAQIVDGFQGEGLR